MVDDGALYRFRLRLFSLAEELHNVREACRIFGVHPSTYYPPFSSCPGRVVDLTLGSQIQFDHRLVEVEL